MLAYRAVLFSGHNSLMTSDGQLDTEEIFQRILGLLNIESKSPTILYKENVPTKVPSWTEFLFFNAFRFEMVILWLIFGIDSKQFKTFAALSYISLDKNRKNY